MRGSKLSALLIVLLVHVVHRGIAATSTNFADRCAKIAKDFPKEASDRQKFLKHVKGDYRDDDFKPTPKDYMKNAATMRDKMDEIVGSATPPMSTPLTGSLNNPYIPMDQESDIDNDLYDYDSTKGAGYTLNVAERDLDCYNKVVEQMLSLPNSFVLDIANPVISREAAAFDYKVDPDKKDIVGTGPVDVLRRAERRTNFVVDGRVKLYSYILATVRLELGHIIKERIAKQFHMNGLQDACTTVVHLKCFVEMLFGVRIFKEHIRGVLKFNKTGITDAIAAERATIEETKKKYTETACNTKAKLPAAELKERLDALNDRIKSCETVIRSCEADLVGEVATLDAAFLNMLTMIQTRIGSFGGVASGNKGKAGSGVLPGGAVLPSKKKVTHFLRSMMVYVLDCGVVDDDSRDFSGGTVPPPSTTPQPP